ncbi:MAG: Maf family protein [Actinomycetota bacterium]
MAFPGLFAAPYRIAPWACETCGVPRLILASSSPRRRLLLASAGFEFDVDVPSVNEEPRVDEDPNRMVARLAREKSLAVPSEPGDVVLAADTTVVLDGAILGKPADEEEAVEMLLSIAARTHVVLTGWALSRAGSIIEEGFESSLVSMRDVNRAEAEAYAASGEPLDKAGAYALQGEGSRFVTGVVGPRSNVIGLPLRTIVAALHRVGVEPRR